MIQGMEGTGVCCWKGGGGGCNIAVVYLMFIEPYRGMR